MTLPGFVFGSIIAGLIGTGFHFWRGGSLGRLFLYLILSWVGFWAGQLLAVALSLHLFQVGPLYLGTASLVCFIFLGFGSWLSPADEPVTS